MFKLINFNVEKHVETEFERDKLIDQGYELIEEKKPKKSKKDDKEKE